MENFSYLDILNPQKALRDLQAKAELDEDEKALLYKLLEMKKSYDERDKELIKIHEEYGIPWHKVRKNQYYDLKGSPISMWQWAELNTWHKQIALTITNGYKVSTVYLGIDHGWPNLYEEDEPYFPVIFETMIFAQNEKTEDSGLDDYQERYCFEDEALMGHIRAVQTVMNYV